MDSKSKVKNQTCIDDLDPWPIWLINWLIIALMVADTSHVVLDSFIGLPSLVIWRCDLHVSHISQHDLLIGTH